VRPVVLAEVIEVGEQRHHSSTRLSAAGRRSERRGDIVAASAMPETIPKLLASMPHGACTVCLARRSGERREEVEEFIGRFMGHVEFRIHDGICPECGAIGRIVRAL
jgi:hypothetical protein